MKIRRTDRFKKDYQKLPLDIQQRVDQKLRFLLRDPHHPSLAPFLRHAPFDYAQGRQDKSGDEGSGD